MLLLYGIGFVAGMIAGISPCILPVLPVVLVAGATVPTADTETESPTDLTTDLEAGPTRTPAGTRGSGDSLRAAVRRSRPSITTALPAQPRPPRGSYRRPTPSWPGSW